MPGRLIWALAACLLATSAGAQTPERPQWLRKPSPEKLRAVWPADALKNGVSGMAVIRCVVSNSRDHEQL